MSANGKARKAIIFDCDNTLWGGVLGEDGKDGIALSLDAKNGEIFREIQYIALSLSQQGVIVGLCSKNNSEDVDEVLNYHPEMILQDKDISIKKVNWLDKATNIKAISKELNIGLDSIVFVDDSLFEINLVKEQLPDVITLQVPEKIFEYPAMLRNNLGLFYSLSHSKEDSAKTKMYREEIHREKNKSEFTSLSEYFTSLGMSITIYKNKESLVARQAQITQKTNQFNLTTKRYTENEIRNFVLSSNYDVYSFLVEDKFGLSGVTGLCIVIKGNDTRQIDSFAMSCRVIGRNIEFVFIDYLVSMLSKEGVASLKSSFINTKKNKQVEEFYEKCSFDLISSDGLVKSYNLILNKYKQSGINYIEVKNNGE